MSVLNIVFPYSLKGKLKKNNGCWKGQILVSPRMAKEWLKKNENNRPVNKRWVSVLAKAMSAGKFKYNADTIRFDTKGNLLDGQHRLLAIIRSNTSVLVDIVVGLQADVFSTMDQNKNRSSTDIAKTSGFTNFRVAGSAVKSIIGINLGDYKRSFNPYIPAYDVEEFYKNNPKYDDVCEVASKIAKGHKMVSKTWVATYLWIFSDYDWDKAEQFVTQVAQGTNLKAGSPVLKLRNFIEKVKLTPSLSMNRGALRALTIKAWNAFVTDTPIKKLKFNPDETITLVGR